MSKKLEECEKEELLEVIKQLKSRKKFGLVWEEKPEQVVEQCRAELPVLEEVKERAISKIDNAPTNLIIEGDNFHALSVLNYTHAGKIDVIYIDPPYNTGNKDFVYNDQYVDSTDTYRNSKWLSFMEHRLQLARNLLKNSGMLFVSIDDNEAAELKLLCNEIFGRDNFIAQIVVQLNPRGRTLDKHFAKTFEYILVFGKRIGETSIRELEKEEDKVGEYKHSDEKGAYRLLELRNRNPVFNRKNRPNLFYPFYASTDGHLSTEPFNGAEEILPRNSLGEDGCWTWGKAKAKAEIDRLISTKNKDKWRVFRKDYLFDEAGSIATSKPKSLWLEKEINNEKGKEVLKRVFGEHLFDFPKSVDLIKKCIKLASSPSGIVLDFFAGSGTTGHAVSMLNQEEGGKRQFILCTNNENGIAEQVTYPRIQKVIEGYGETEGIPANIRYYKTAFVTKNDATDDTRYELVQRAADMICVREGTFDQVIDTETIKLYSGASHHTAILYDFNQIDKIKEEIEKLDDKPVHIYVFSLTNDSYESDFADLRQNYELCPIPESILEVYRRIFGGK